MATAASLETASLSGPLSFAQLPNDLIDRLEKLAMLESPFVETFQVAWEGDIYEFLLSRHEGLTQSGIHLPAGMILTCKKYVPDALNDALTYLIPRKLSLECFYNVEIEGNQNLYDIIKQALELIYSAPSEAPLPQTLTDAHALIEQLRLEKEQLIAQVRRGLQREELLNSEKKRLQKEWLISRSAIQQLEARLNLAQIVPDTPSPYSSEFDETPYPYPPALTPHPEEE